MRLTLVAVGKLKLVGTAKLQDEYLKRLRHYGRFEVVEVAASKQRELSRRQEEEAQRIERALDPRARWIGLDSRGRKLTSPGLADFLQEESRHGSVPLALVIGGSDGFSEGLRGQFSAQVSFSDLTFPHQLFRVMALEQVYRAQTILRGEPYHK